MEKLDIQPLKIYNFTMKKNTDSSSLSYAKKILPDDLYKNFVYLSSVFSLSDFLQEMSTVQDSKDTVAISPFSFAKGKYVFYFCDNPQKHDTEILLELAQKMDLNLTDYNVYGFEAENSRASVVLALAPGKHVNDYELVQNLDNASPVSKKTLFNEINKLCRQGIAVNPSAIYYNQDTDDFKLLNIQEMSRYNFDTLEKREKYLERYKELCQIK